HTTLGDYKLRGVHNLSKKDSSIAVKSKSPGNNKGRKLFGIGILYLLPALLLLGVFLFYPMFRTLYFSFFEVGGGGVVGDFIGWEHYIDLVQSDEFRKSMVGTFLFV